MLFSSFFLLIDVLRPRALFRCFCSGCPKNVGDREQFRRYFARGLRESGDFARGALAQSCRVGGKASGTSSGLFYMRIRKHRSAIIEISPVAARPKNPKRSTLMKASFQRADLFVFADFVGGLISFLCGSIFRCSMCNLLSNSLLGYIGTTARRNLK